MELLWQNGQVVMLNQTQRSLKKPLLPPTKFHLEDAPSLLHHVLPHKPPDGGGDVGPSTAPEQQLYIHEDEMASWLQYPLDDAADICSDLLYPQPTPAASAADRRLETKPSSARPPPIPPPRRPTDGEPDKTAANFAMFSRLKGKAAAQAQSASEKMGGMESTVVDSSVTPARVAAGNRAAGSERDGGGTCDPTVTSSSGGSGGSAGDRASKPAAADDRKRKGREGDEFEELSEVSFFTNHLLSICLII